MARSRAKSEFLRRESGLWDQLRRQRDLVDRANELLAGKSAEAEDLRLRCSDLAAEATTARKQAAPLAEKVRKLEEDLARVTTERDSFKAEAEREAASAKILGEELETQKTAYRLKEGALTDALKVATDSRNEALQWKEKAEGLEKELTSAAAASAALQMALDAESREHMALQGAVHSVCDALEVERSQSGSSLLSRLTALCGQVHERLREALHIGVKRALAVVSSHYSGINLEAISDGYVIDEEDEDKAEEELMKLVEAAEAPGATLAKLFEKEVVPSPADDAENL